MKEKYQTLNENLILGSMISKHLKQCSANLISSMENLQPRNLPFHKIARYLIVSHLSKKVHPNLSKFRYGESMMHPLGSIRFSFVMIVHKYHDEITKPAQERHCQYTHNAIFFLLVFSSRHQTFAVLLMSMTQIEQNIFDMQSHK